MAHLIKKENIHELEASIINKINKLLGLNGIPGLAIGIVKNNALVFSKGFGVKNILKKEPIQPESIFHTSSISKIFVAVAIMQLEEQGKIDLTSPVIKYLPYFKLKDSDFKRITIKQLLNHSSGLPDVDKTVYDTPEYDENALERYVDSLADKNLLFKPGTRFAYTDIGYDVLGDVIAKVSGMSFEEYMKKNVLLPLDMKKSTFLKEEVPDNELVLPHIRKQKRLIVNEIYPYSRNQAPSSTFHSNVIEICNFIIASLNKGKFKDKQILKPATYELLWEPIIKTNINSHNAYMGLGWFIGEYRGFKIVGHSGGEFGFLAHLFLFPEKSLGMVILMNSFHSPNWNLTSAFLDILIGYKPKFLDNDEFNFLKQLLNTKTEERKDQKILLKLKKKKQKKTMIKEEILKFLAKFEVGATVARINEETKIHRNTIKKYLAKMELEGLVYSQIIGSFTVWFISPTEKGIIIEMYEINHDDYFKKFLAAYFQQMIISEGEAWELMNKIGREICEMSNFPFKEFDFKSKFINKDGMIDLLKSATFILKFLQSSKLFGEDLECEIVPAFDNKDPQAILIRIKALKFLDEGSFLLYPINCGFIDQLLQKFGIPLNFSLKSFNKTSETCYYELSVQKKL